MYVIYAYRGLDKSLSKSWEICFRFNSVGFSGDLNPNFGLEYINKSIIYQLFKFMSKL